MKKDIAIIICVNLIAAIILFHFCLERKEKEEFRRIYKETCEDCGERCKDKYQRYDDYFLCADCAVGYSVCRNCKKLYNGGWSTDHYCEHCADKNTLDCFLCTNNRFEKENMVDVIIDGDVCYMCISCASSYFSNVENIKRCFCCSRCYELSGAAEYECTNLCVVCERCVEKYGYVKCTQCQRYDDSLIDGTCEYCKSGINKPKGDHNAEIHKES